jgi:hypothetical protein
MITRGTQSKLIDEVTLGAGSTSVNNSIETDSLAATVWVDSITSGSLIITIYTFTDTGKEVALFSFPALTAGSTELLLRKSGVSLQNFRVEAVYTGVCEYEIYVRAIEGAGAASTRILGAASMKTSQKTVDDSGPQLLLAASLEDRSGILIKNWNQNGDLYISEDAAKLNSQAMALGPRDCFFVDLEAGQELYAKSSSGSVDVRIVEVGGA